MDAPPPVSSADAIASLRARVATNRRDIEARIALAHSLAEAGDPWSALAEGYDAHRVDRRRRETIDALRAPVAAACDALRQRVSAVLSGESAATPLPASLEPLGREQKLDLLRFAFELIDEPRFILLPDDAEHGSFAEAEAAGLDPDALRAFAAAQRRRRAPYPYQLSLLDKGTFTIPSPLDGAPAEARASLLVWTEQGRPVLAYPLAGSEPVLAIASPYRGELAALFFAARNLLVGNAASRGLTRAIAQLQALALVFATDTARVVAAPGAKRPTLLSGAMNHFGHQMLNELVAWVRCAEEGRLGRLTGVVDGGVAFVPHAALFPELAHLPVTKLTSLEDAFAASVAPDQILVRPTCGEYLFSRALRERLLAAVLTAEVDDPRLEQASACTPLLWFELRGNHRLWEDQADGIAGLAAALAEDHPGLGIVLAGWSTPLGTSLPAYDATMIATHREVVADIRARLSPNLPVFDLVGVPTLTKLRWALAVDAFVAGFGTGLIFPLGLGRVPGVIHSNGPFLREVIATGWVGFVEDPPPVRILDPAKPRDIPTERHHHSWNYRLDWRDLIEDVRAVLAQATAAKGRRPGAV